MRNNLTVGILRETKQDERRAPLVPSDVRWLIKRGVSVEVENNNSRIFKDIEYKKKGAKIVDRFRNASLILGIKEPRPEDLYKNKIYMVFSHTAKGQSQNMPLLKQCLKNKITLIDYEKMIDSHDRRLVYFGRFAGICGIVDSFHYLGRKLRGKGIDNPFMLIKPAHAYSSLNEVKKAFQILEEQIRKKGFRKEISPFIIGITGHGNVSRGAQEILELLYPVEVHPQDMLKFVRHQKSIKNKIFKIVFLREEKFRSKNGKRFYFEEYLKHPYKFRSNLDLYLPYLNILLHSSYWDRRCPRMVTKEMIHSLTKKKPFRLEFIGDISCDVNGSIELTYRTTKPDNPTFTYNYKSREFVDGIESEGISILAVDNLSSELPKDASIEFSRRIRDYVYQIAAHGVKDIGNHIAIPAEVRKAVIAQSNKLTENFSYLRKYLAN